MRPDDGCIREGAELIHVEPQFFEDGFPAPSFRPDQRSTSGWPQSRGWQHNQPVHQTGAGLGASVSHQLAHVEVTAPCATTALAKLPDERGPMMRREKFRTYMSRVAAAANPALAIEQKLYVHPPGAISDMIVARLELDPSSRHLIVGGIGSGKSTQLLIAEHRFLEHEDIRAAYVDVSEKLDLAQLRPGCLVALAGLKLGEHLGEDAKIDNWRHFKDWSEGYWTHPDEWDGDDGDPSAFVPGILKPPKPEWVDIPNIIVSILNDAHIKLSKGNQTLVLLFDSLDRVTDKDAFTRVLEQDIPALKKAGIGIVLIGPIRSMEGFGRLDADRFDYLHIQAPVDIAFDEVGTQFLMDVLHRRAGTEMLTSAALPLLVEFSGGVLRDLLNLAKAAGTEAYLRGAEVIDVPHVIVAADNHGRSLMIGLKPEEIETLKHLRSTGGFVRTSEDDLALILTRRILEYRSPQARYAVHPTIAPLLDQIAGRK
ncbi:hypothetical protein COSO111634_12595 [Corallococcus soli]